MNCPYCQNKNTFTYFRANLPNIPGACPETTLSKVKIFLFEAKLCPHCLLGFNATKLENDELKLIYDNYVHISPMQGIGITKYYGMIRTLKKFYSKEEKILEIGCSEGYLLNELKKEGYKNLIGIEPSPLANQAKKLGLTIVRDYFDENIFRDKLFDGFYLMHVYEHLDNPFSILESMRNHLAPNGKITIEVPNFSGYQHQHLFFFNLPFLAKLCDEKDLKIIKKYTEKGSLRVVIAHKDNDKYKEIRFCLNPENIVNHAYKEYKTFTKKIIKLNQIIKNNQGTKIYWWGAGSASVVYFNQIDPSLREKSKIIIVDGDKNKWGCYISGIDFKVNPYKIIRNCSIDWLIIASSFHNEIQNTMRFNNISAKNIEIFD
jgi:2-polyprenyl-3-methyl-5-hydroxy-6-metoxy-1,4-benzoquinol methylase